MKDEVGMEQAIRAELGKISKANPNAIPLYIILNSARQEDAVEQPLTLCSRESSVKDLLIKLHRKYPKFKHIYFFGKEQSGQEQQPLSVKKKRKGGTGVAAEEGERIIAIDEGMMGSKVQEIHGLYKDARGLLVMVVSESALVAKSRQSFYEPILLSLAVLFAIAFLYLSFSEEQAPKNATSEIDYLV